MSQETAALLARLRGFLLPEGDAAADYISTYGGGSDDQGGCQETPGSLNVFLRDGKGNFVTGNTYPIGPSTNISIAVGDFNHDGRPDLALLSYSTHDCARAPAQRATWT